MPWHQDLEGDYTPPLGGDVAIYLREEFSSIVFSLGEYIGPIELSVAEGTGFFDSRLLDSISQNGVDGVCTLASIEDVVIVEGS